jgi:hypothetical protein
MRRLTGLVLLTFALAVASLATAGDPKAKPAAQPDLKKDPAEKADPDKKPGDGPKEDEGKELVARIAKNMEKSTDRLSKNDPQDVTRQIQRDIVKDLDVLIEQFKQQQQQQQEKASSGGARGEPQQGKKGAGQGSPQQGKKGQGGEGNGSKSQARPGGKGQESKGEAKSGGKDGKGEPGQAKQEGKDGKDGQGDPGQAKQGGKDGQGMLGKVKDAEKRNALADLFPRAIWGHLPEARRMEMDAYSKEHFMRKYEDLLKQYYRTISEQNRR